MRNFPAKKINSDEFASEIAGRIDEFEGYVNPHAVRIASFADALAKQFNLGSLDRRFLRQAALVHDIGEFAMNREYINSNRILSEEECFDMRRHTVIGEQEAAKRGLSRAVQLMVRWHHEWWNGFGYPDALRRKQIPLSAAILRVADTYSALTDNRPFRQSVSAKDARQYLTEWAGIEFNPQVVKAFLSLEGLE